MKYFSTRDVEKNTISSKEAIIAGLAPDGGLYIPCEFPKPDFLLWKGLEYSQIALEVLKLYLDDYSEQELKEAVEKAYATFETGVVPLRNFQGFSFLELFHGRTLAFKDIALSLLPHLMSLAKKDQGLKEDLVIVTATSGDTGKAALEGFKEVENMKVVVYYPKEGVSPLQELQMVTTQGENTCVIAVEGNFDHAQAGVKKIFSQETLQKKLKEEGILLSSANSINIGRLLPQIVYYFYGYLKLLEEGMIEQGEAIDVCVPTGNFGNILAAYYAKKMGLPVESLLCASNDNRVLTDFFENGIYDANRELVPTGSPSMDILVSSNLERLLFDQSQDGQEVKELMEQLKSQGEFCRKEPMEGFYAYCVTEKETQALIKEVFKELGYVMDPHTAVGYGAYKKHGKNRHTLIASTASPYKFAETVLKSLERDVEESLFEQVQQLEKLTKMPIPQQIKELITLPVLHTTTVSKENPQEALMNFLEVSL